MKLMVIDGNSILNRAFYGVRPLSTQDGTPTNAVFGFLNILLKLVDEEKLDGKVDKEHCETGMSVVAAAVRAHARDIEELKAQ